MTYSTTQECALAAGIRNVGVNSRPSESEIDLMRELAYTVICEFLGGELDDNSVGTLRSIEIELVRDAIWAFLEMDRRHEMALSPNQIARIRSNFSTLTGLSWDPS